MNILVENTLVKFSQSSKDKRMQRLLATIWVTMAYTGLVVLNIANSSFVTICNIF